MRTVEIAERTEYVKIKADGKDVPLVAVLKQPNSNLIDVAGEVSAKVEELNKLLPEGVVLKPYYNQSEFVNSQYPQYHRCALDWAVTGNCGRNHFPAFTKSQCSYSDYHSGNAGAYFYCSHFYWLRF